MTHRNNCRSYRTSKDNHIVKRRKKLEGRNGKIYDKITIIGALATIFSAYISLLFKSSVYQMKIAYYDYFHLDKQYMQIDYEYSLVRTLIYFAIAVSLILASVVLNKESKKLNSFVSKFILWSKFSVILVLINCFVLLIYFRMDVRVFILAIIEEPIYFLLIEIALLLMEISFSIFCRNLCFDWSSTLKEIISNNVKQTKVLIFPMCVYFLICVPLISFGTIYFINYNNCSDIKDFAIVKVDGEKYAIMEAYHDMHYTYSCEIDEKNNILKLNPEITRFLEMQENDMTARSFDKIEGV